MEQKLIIFTADFPPKDGGVANYAFAVAKTLSRENRLLKVYTFSEINAVNQLYPIEKISLPERNLGKVIGDKIGIVRKINTLNHYKKISTITRAIFNNHSKSEVKVIVVSAYGYQQVLTIQSLIKLGIEYTLVLHGLEIVNNSKQIHKLFSKVVTNANKIIVNSNATKKLFQITFPQLKKDINIQYPIIDTKTINQLKLHTPSELADIFNINLTNKKVFFSATRLVKRKGIDLAIKAIAQLHTKYPDIIYLIAGKGEEYNYLEKLINKLNASDFIKLIGYISDKEKFSLLNQSSIFLLPTQSLGNTDFEGFGISFIEASYMKNVVIGGIHGGVTESILNNETGFNIDFDKPDGSKMLLDKISNLLKNPNLIENMSIAGNKYVTDNFCSINYKHFTS